MLLRFKLVCEKVSKLFRRVQKVNTRFDWSLVTVVKPQGYLP